MDQVVAEEPSTRLYRTNAERREAGRKRQITPWLTASTLAELEWESEDFKVKGTNQKEGDSNAAATLQLGLVAEPWEVAKGELVLEYDTDINDLFVEEAFVSLEHEPWELEIGKFYLPFGVFLSNFPTGPILELGETRARAASLAYGPDDRVDFKLAAYRSPTHSHGRNSYDIGWSGGFELWPRENLSFGMSFLSDLADADSNLLEDSEDCCGSRVPGLSGYLVWVGEQFDFTLEALGALSSFEDLDQDRDRPFAWNLEVAHFPMDNLSWALRIEGSHEVEEEPRLQFGIAVTGRLVEDTSLTFEFLHGRFEGELATNDDDESYDWVNRLGAQLSIAF